MHAADFYEQHEIELMTGTTVTAIDPGASRVTLDGGGVLSYDRLLLTTGSEPRRITAPGAELDGIYYTRSLADCDVLRRRLDDSGRVLNDGYVVGGMNVNVWDVNQRVRGLIRSRRPVDVAALADLDTPLDSLVTESTA